KAQAKGAPMMLRLSIRPRRAPTFEPGNGEDTTDGNTSRMRASACCGGVTPVTACIRSPAMSSVPWSILDYLKFVFIDTNERRFAKAGRTSIDDSGRLSYFDTGKTQSTLSG